MDNHYFVNLRAPVLLTKEFVERFKENKHGRVVNITSGQSLSAMSDEIAYAVPKGRLGLPEDAAKLVGFLVHENADWITGQIIHSEGGFVRENYDC